MFQWVDGANLFNILSDIKENWILKEILIAKVDINKVYF